MAKRQLSEAELRQRREASRKGALRGGLARARTLTREHQRQARAKVKPESLSRSGKKGAQATLARHGMDRLFKAWRRWKLANPSREELIVIGILRRLGLACEREMRLGETLFTVDFFLPGQGRAIEVNGGVHDERMPGWQERAEQQERKAALLAELGIPLLVIHHSEMDDVAALIERIRAFAGDRAASPAESQIEAAV